MTDTLADFDRRTVTFDSQTYDVFVAGEGPAILVLPEMPGLTPDVADFARRMVAAGFSAWVPSLFGTPGRDVSYPYLGKSMIQACVSRLFKAFARGGNAPIVGWLRQLGAMAHEESGGPGIGVVGMCFTGNFALALAVDERVLVPVMSQPSLPIGPTKAQKADIHLSGDALRTVQERTRTDDLCVIGLRFTRDPFVFAERFETLRSEFGEAFIGVEIDSSEGNEWDFAKDAHSVLTTEWSDTPGHPAGAAHDLVVEHFTDKLLAT